MLAFIVSRILQAVPVILVVGLIAFAMFAFVGDPVTIMLGTDYMETQRIALTKQFGLDQPSYPPPTASGCPTSLASRVSRRMPSSCA